MLNKGNWTLWICYKLEPTRMMTTVMIMSVCLFCCLVVCLFVVLFLRLFVCLFFCLVFLSSSQLRIRSRTCTMLHACPKRQSERARSPPVACPTGFPIQLLLLPRHTCGRLWLRSWCRRFLRIWCRRLLLRRWWPGILQQLSVMSSCGIHPSG